MEGGVSTPDGAAAAAAAVPDEVVIGAVMPADGRPELVAITEIRAGTSPRMSGVDPAHVAVLVQLADLPPVLVQRRGMRLIDGAHRLAAAAARGEITIGVRYVDCGDDEAFVLAVALNTGHGLPLTLKERRAAAARILAWRPDASDRWVGSVTGLAPRTVASVRSEQPGSGAAGDAEPGLRLGRDGRTRPVDASVARRRATELVMADPRMSVRELARASGLSVGTAWSVRKSVREGTAAPPTPRGPRQRPSGEPRPAQQSPADTAALLGSLRRDPRLRYTDTGRSVLRWLCPPRVLEHHDWAGVIDLIPAYAAGPVIALARNCAESWTQFAAELERRSTTGLP
jgi:Winged helix-turn-helix DNA-binding